jgi:hypothetical protein
MKNMKDLQPKQRKSRRPTGISDGTETDGTTTNPLFEEEDVVTAVLRLGRIQRETMEQEEQAMKRRKVKSIHVQNDTLVQTSQVRAP